MVRIDSSSNIAGSEGLPQQPKKGELGGRKVSQKSNNEMHEALRKAAQKPLPAVPTKKMKAPPTTPRGVTAAPKELSNRPFEKTIPADSEDMKTTKLTERQEKKFVVVKRDGKEFLKHHSALSFTEKYFGMGVTKKGASALSTHDTTDLAATVIKLRTAHRTGNEAAMRAVLKATPVERHEELLGMLGLTKNDPQIQKALQEKTAKAVLNGIKHDLHEAFRVKNFQLAFSHIKNAPSDAAATLIAALTDDQLSKIFAVSHNEKGNKAADLIQKRYVEDTFKELRAALRDGIRDDIHTIRENTPREIMDAAIVGLTDAEKQEIGQIIPTFISNPTLKLGE